MACASGPFAAAAAVSALCWVPQGSAAARPRSYLLEAQDRQALGTRLQQQRQQRQRRRQLQTHTRSAAGKTHIVGKKMKKKGLQKGCRRGGGEGEAAEEEKEDAEEEMQVDEDDAEGGDRRQDEEAGASEAESMEAADGDEEEDDDESQHLFGVVREDGHATLNDPYLNLDEGEDSEEEEANCLLPTDLLLVAANAEQDCSSLEVYVYDEDSGSFYVHHDILTGGYPLCLEWLNTCPSSAGGASSSAADTTKRNLVASGSFDPEISIWDLDVLDRIDAVCTLGGEPRLTAGRPAARKLSKKKKKNQQPAATAASSAHQGHKGPVMTLHKAPMKRHVLGSGSADETVKVWDLTTGACVHTYNHHSNKVQAIRWHPTEEAALLTTGYDRRAAVLDVRSPQDIVHAPSLSADAESCVWDRHHPFTFWVSTEDGCVTCYDVRRMESNNHASKGGEQRPGMDATSLLWRIQAHKQAASGVTDSIIPDLMVTCGVDGDGKLWKVSPESGISSAGDDSSGSRSASSSTSGSRSEQDTLVGASHQPEQPSAGGCCAPTLIFERSLKAGPLYCCSSNEDNPQVLSFGGNCVVIWDITDTEHVKRIFRLKS